MISFDIFDTLITRMTLTPEGIFALAAKKVFSLNKDKDFYYDGIVQDFVELRVIAEKNVRRRYQKIGKKEVSIDAIYDIILESCFASDAIVLELKKTEIEFEIECAVPIYQNVKLVEKCRNSGQKIVLISDMYLPKTVIRNILRKVTPTLSDLPLYLSCDTGYTKIDGSMFIYVKEQEKVDYESWTHYGNDLKSDYIIPKMLGIDVEKIFYWAIPDTLQYYIFNTKRYDLNSQIEFGIMKYLMGYYDSDMCEMAENDLRGFITGVTVGGPLIYPYVMWIINDCILNKIKNIYFLSRDGYVLKNVADVILEDYKSDIKTHYLYSSRQAWQTTNFDILLQYSEQEIDLKNKIALVDVQGTGYTVNCFINSLRTKYEFRPRVYYYSYDYSGNNFDYDIKSYSFEKDDYILEALCRAPQDQLIGYESENGLIKLMFEKTGIDWNGVGITSYSKGVCEFVRLLTGICRNFDLVVRTHRLETLIKQYLLNIGDEKTDKFLGDMPFEYSIEEGIQYYAKPMSVRQAMDIYLLGRQDLIGGVRRKIAFRRASKDVKNMISGLDISINCLSEKERVIIDDFINNHINKNTNIVKRCVVYGAGEYGRTIYRLIDHVKEYELIAWTDINYERIKINDVNIIPPFELRNMSFDLLIVAIKDKKTAEGVINIMREILNDDVKIIKAESFFCEIIRNC